MKRAAIMGVVLTIATWATAQKMGGQAATPAQPAQTQAQGQATPAQGQTAPAAGQTAPAQGAAAPAATEGKRPPQAKTQPEFDAYKAASENKDNAALEKASDDFATKFPDSELRIILYKTAMRGYQNANNAEKTEAMGRKVLGLDADDPEALVLVAEVLTERTRDSDLDKDQRWAEAEKYAKHATETIETDVAVPAGTPQEKIDAYKSLLRSNAYSILGTLAFKKDDFPNAEKLLRQSIDAFPSSPDPVVVLRLALALDKQNRYPDALKVAEQAVSVAQEGSSVKQLAQRERDRLVQLTGGKPATATPDAAKPAPEAAKPAASPEAPKN
jgi:tetratricopeptide (TPR) repeat protein